MKKVRVSSQILLCFFMMMFLVAANIGCSKSDDAPTATTYSISGVVSGDITAGVTIYLTGTSAATATTATGGTYSFTGLANGTYTVTPALADYTFAPTSTAVVVNGSNMIADFAATYDTSTKYSISGTVSGDVASGVQITLSGDSSGSITTGTDGTYSFTNLVSGDYTVTPYLSGYAFTPTHLDISSLSADSTGNDFTSAASAFTMADLAGTWRVSGLIGGNLTGWLRATVTLDSAGTLTWDACADSTGSNTYCTNYEAKTIVWSINTATGEITETADGDPSDNHYTLTSNKKFLSGTQHEVATPHPGLLTAQKVVTGTSYANSDVRGKNFVHHQLSVGTDNEWGYGGGSTDGTSGEITLSSEYKPGGTGTTGDTGAAISVDSSGVVTMSGGMTDYQGFLSDDKKTIVGTWTESGDYRMMIIQLTDGQSSSTSAGTFFGHMLTVGSGTEAPFWAHQAIRITSGVMTFSDWVCSNAAVSGPSSSVTYTLSVNSSGTATIAQSSGSTDFHGQVSYDGTFMVGIQTFGTNEYSLMVITKASSLILSE